MTRRASWPVVPLAEVTAETQYGTSEKANESGRGLPMLRMGNIDYQGSFDLSDLKHIELRDSDRQRYTVKRGDLLFNRTNSQELVGKLGAWDHDEEFAFAGYLIRIRLKPDLACPKFVAAYFNTPEMKSQLRTRAKPSISMSNINATELIKFLIPLPPLAEQQRIAAILDQADALRAKRRTGVQMLTRLLQASYAELKLEASFGDWPELRIDEISEFQTGFAFRSEEYSSEPRAVKLCRGANVMPDRLDWSDLASWPASRVREVERFQLRESDVVIAMDRPWISEGFKVAQVGSADLPCLLLQRVARLRVGELVKSSVLYQALRQPEFKTHCKPTETTVPHISPDEIRGYTFPVPPMSVQVRFDKIAAAIGRLTAVHSASLSKLDALFASLQHRAFRGEL